MEIRTFPPLFKYAISLSASSAFKSFVGERIRTPFASSGTPLPTFVDALIAAETGIATVLVAYVFVRYAVFLLGHAELPERGTVGDSRLLTRLAARFEREHADAEPLSEAVAGEVIPPFPARGPVSAYALRHPR